MADEPALLLALEGQGLHIWSSLGLLHLPQHSGTQAWEGREEPCAQGGSNGEAQPAPGHGEGGRSPSLVGLNVCGRQSTL